VRAAFAHLGSAKAFPAVSSFLSVCFACFVWGDYWKIIVLRPEIIVSVPIITTPPVEKYWE